MSIGRSRPVGGGRSRGKHRWRSKPGGSCGPVTITKADGTVEEKPPLSPRELRQVVKERPSIPQPLRLKILARDNYCCRYCGVLGVEFVMEHVTPVALGGATTMRNLVTACVECNVKKGVRVWKPRSLRKTYS